MKKVLFVGALALVSLASCKKDYTCSCSGTDLPENFKKFEYSKMKKDDAEAACSSQQTVLKSGGYTDASCSI